MPYFEGSSADQYVEYSYDDIGRISSETVYPGEITTSYTYDNLTTTIDKDGQTYEKEYDASGLLHISTDPGGSITYNYNAEGKVKSINSPSGTTSIDYDDYGYQDKLHDIDARTIDYDYNGFGELISQTDSVGNECTMQYDAIGRIKQKAWSGGEAVTYHYDSTTGLLTNIHLPNKSKSFTYDEYYRVLSRKDTVENNIFNSNFFYDEYGNMISEEINDDITVDYVFNGYGYLDQVEANDQLVWNANSMNRYGQVDDYTLGNNANTVISYDQYGFVDTKETKIGSTWIQNWDYDFESGHGNMVKRKGIKPAGGFLEETFTYDDLNRLKTYTVGNNSDTIFYDSGGKGNISTKTDIGDYYYSLQNVHRLDSIKNLSETLPDMPTQDITYTKFNKISTLTHTSPSLTKELTFTYGTDEQRVKTIYTENSNTIKTKYFGLGKFEKEIASDNSTRKLYYISTPSGLTAIIEKTSSQTNIYYIHTDIIGSYDAITNSSGTILERLSFDPWGRRRNPADWTYEDVPTTYMFDRGFTGHEHLDKFDLINMNGRVYDPLLATFLSPDNFVQSPDYTQNFNRYAYCLFSPFKYTDPDGEWFITALVTLANMYLCTSATNDWQFNPVKWDWSSPKTWVSLGQSGIAGYKIGSSAENFIKQRSFDRKMDRLSEKVLSEYKPMERLAVPDGSLISNQDIYGNYHGSIIHDVIESKNTFGGNDIQWIDVYSDGSEKVFDSFEGTSGLEGFYSRASEGRYCIENLRIGEAFKNYYQGVDPAPYTRHNILFAADLIGQFPGADPLLKVHPCRGIATKGCIGLTESVDRLLQYLYKLDLYLKRHGSIKCLINYR